MPCRCRVASARCTDPELGYFALGRRGLRMSQRPRDTSGHGTSAGAVSEHVARRKRVGEPGSVLHGLHGLWECVSDGLRQWGGRTAYCDRGMAAANPHFCFVGLYCTKRPAAFLRRAFGCTVKLQQLCHAEYAIRLLSRPLRLRP